MPLDFADLLGLAAFTLNLLLIVKIAFQPAEDWIGKTLLLVLLTGFATMIANQLYALMGLFLVLPHYAGATIGLMYAIGPLLYLYIRRLTLGASPREQRFWYLHWLLPFAVTLYLVPFYILSAGEKLALFQSQNSGLSASTIINLGYYLQILIYIFLSLRPLRTYQQEILNNFSDIKQINLGWLKKICYGLVLIILLDVLLPLTGVVATPLYHVFLSANSLFIVVLAYSALGQSRLGFPLVGDGTLDEKKLHNLGNGGDGRKYSRSGLRDDTARYYLNKLDNVMTAQQWFLEESLTLKVLAERLHISAHHLSQLLNEQMQTTFYDYINELRVNHAKKLLSDNPKRPVIDIATDSGYINKGTFYSAFKRRVGMTPSQYRRQVAANSTPKREVACK